MKTPKPTRLPSGRWRVQLSINGKRYSFTGNTKEEARQKAKEAYAGAQIEKRSPLTVGKAIDKYINSKTGVLSPSTIMVYKRYRKNYLQCIMDINLTELSQEDVQIAVSEDAAEGLSPKTIRNAHGLLSAVLKVYRPKMILRTTLPQKLKYEVRIPTEEEIIKIWTAAKGTRYELPILLASWLGLRMSEIRGLKRSDFVDGYVHVQRAVIRGENGSQEKVTKTTSGDRWITCPKEISQMVDKIDTDGYICDCYDTTLYSGFVSICKKAGVEPCRFHDLRHFAASEAHSLGVPDKYAMHRMGHKTDNMLKTVYQHIMRDKESVFANVIDKHMSELFLKSTSHKIAHAI